MSDEAKGRVEARGSRFSRDNGILFAVACLVFAGWFTYDGYISKEYQKKETNPDGSPTANLRFNRMAPFVLVPAAVVFAGLAVRVTRRRIVADEQGLKVAGGPELGYDRIRMIDKRLFEKEGHFTITYTDGAVDKKLKLTTRQYDHLKELLDEVVRRTGAEPVTEQAGGGAESARRAGNGPGDQPNSAGGAADSGSGMADSGGGAANSGGEASGGADDESGDGASDESEKA